MFPIYILCMEDFNTQLINEPFHDDDTLLCGGIFELAKEIRMHVVLRKHFLNIFEISRSIRFRISRKSRRNVFRYV